MDHISTLHHMRRRHELHFGHRSVTYDEHVAFLMGIDHATQDLYGFREFLILRLGSGENLTWTGLVLHLAFPDGYRRPETPEDQAHATEVLLDVAIEFLVEVSYGGGRDRILHEYHSWLRAQSWYRPELETMHSSPAPEVRTADEVAALLGLTRRELFEQVRDLGCFPLRMGAQVVFRSKEVDELVERRSGDGPTS